ncbi:unnamed protein product [Fusarium venenatum]|uniref:Uncharacterized protein n=1 Tax=Fusarium venenatum TaxID=56646 RepID=A0A2L2U054_9HYPO|nr:uncharacterized protein FVRRES_08277 [Fusarium venenatum]CEI68200.1 unnamed protein product [Fusarium venenatum]
MRDLFSGHYTIIRPSAPPVDHNFWILKHYDELKKKRPRQAMIRMSLGYILVNIKFQYGSNRTAMMPIPMTYETSVPTYYVTEKIAS